MRSVIEVCNGVYVATSRRYVTTSTLVVHGREVLLVDPAWDPDELDQLADLLATRGWTVTAGIATHAHHDHLLGALVGGVQAPDSALAVGEAVELVEHDGHLPGHYAVWLPARATLLAGDMLSDVELPLPLDPDDVPAYLRALDLLEPYVRRARVLIPGHGHPTTRPGERLDADRRYFADLLRHGDADDPRRGHDGMAEVHARIRELVRAFT